MWARAYSNIYMRSPLEFLKMKPGEQMLIKGFIIDKIEGAER